MTKLLLALTLTPLLFTTVHANEVDEIRDYRNSNMLWSDNEEFQRLDNAQDYKILDYRNASMLWPDRLTFSQADRDLINSNMLWSDDYEFRHINQRY